MTPLSPDEEGEMVLALRALLTKFDMTSRVISRETINWEIETEKKKYPLLERLPGPLRRKKISEFCNNRFEKYSLNWKTRSWVITMEGI